MREKVQILTCCSHFDEIVNHDFLEEDLLTKKLIQYYQDFIFHIDSHDERNFELIKKLDDALFKYIEDYHFAKKLKSTLDVDIIVRDDFHYLGELMTYIIEFSEKYDQREVKITPTEWI